jgi:hypothetical protein
VGGGDCGGGVVQARVGVQRPVLWRLQELRHEPESAGVGARGRQCRFRLEGTAEEIRGRELVGAGLPQTLALGDQIPAAP